MFIFNVDLFENSIDAQPLANVGDFVRTCGPNRPKNIFELREALQPSFKRLAIKA
jgi:hypothetical protein